MKKYNHHFLSFNKTNTIANTIAILTLYFFNVYLDTNPSERIPYFSPSFFFKSQRLNILIKLIKFEFYIFFIYNNILYLQ